MNIGDRIKELRISKGLTQNRLAVALGINNSTIGKYETNDRTPDAKMLCILADYFDVSVDFLLDRQSI